MSEARWTAYEHADAIRRFAARRVEPDAVDDVVAETFAIAWRKLPREADPLPWLYAVAGRVVHRHRRSQARRARILHRVTHRDTAVDATEPSELVVQDPVLAHAFEQLTRREREAICLVAWEGSRTPTPRAPPAARRRRSPSATPARARASPLALALSPGNGPRDSSVLVRAVQASELPPGSIVVLEHVATITGHGGIETSIFRHPAWFRVTTWIRTDHAGHLLALRELETASSDSGAVGSESVMHPTHDGDKLAIFGTMRHQTFHATTASRSTIYDYVKSAHRLLVTARAAAAAGRPTHLTRTSVAGRPAFRLRSVTRASSGNGSLVQTLDVDAASYRPLVLRKVDRYVDAHGQQRFTQLTTPFLSERTLPDTPRNRRLLRFGGPTR